MKEDSSLEKQVWVDMKIEAIKVLQEGYTKPDRGRNGGYIREAKDAKPLYVALIESLAEDFGVTERYNELKEELEERHGNK